MAQPTPNYRAEARAILARIPGSTPRDRIAFVYGYVLAFQSVAHYLPPVEYFRVHGIATALHTICTEEMR